ncbi:hypothetical protein PG997_002048 [Apiospora hydei]|uniref:Amidase domain-containing protein n=1 Tax=Apiospora hydei TaxID=1337664 RepID=A0ABR1X835_9PEZI
MVLYTFARAAACFALFLSWQADAMPSKDPVPSLSDISITELQKLLGNGAVTSRDLVDLYASRIAEVNDELHAVIEVDTDSALAAADMLDRERLNGNVRGPLHGIPILVKDNYATTSSSLKTGAGSVCLASGSRPKQEATVITKLRAAGAIVLGKTNQAEFSGARGLRVPAGWSARGGQTYGAYVRNQTACGSSSGSGVAAGLGLAAAALGTETAGSVTCPAAFGNAVGVKPTVGLTSRAGIVPITGRQDSVGVLARNVADAAVVLERMAGRDGRDNYTEAQPWEDGPPRYSEALEAEALRGRRIGVMWHEGVIPGFGRNYWVNKEQIRRLFDEALEILRGAGAVLVDLPVDGYDGKGPLDIPMRDASDYIYPDFKEGLARYYDNLVPDEDESGDTNAIIRNHTQLLECLRTEPRERSAEYSLEAIAAIAEENEPLLPASSAEAWTAYVNVSEATGSLIRTPLREHHLDGLVMYMDLAIGLASRPGMPIVTVPMGGLGNDAQVVYSDEADWDGDAGDELLPRLVVGAPGMPQGLSFVGEKWTEMELIGFAYAYEQASRKRGALRPWVEIKRDLKDRMGSHGIGEL